MTHRGELSPLATGLERRFLKTSKLDMHDRPANFTADLDKDFS